MLSGFVTALNYQDALANVTSSIYRRFLLKRFARLYPVYLVGLLFNAVVVAGLL